MERVTLSLVKMDQGQEPAWAKLVQGVLVGGYGASTVQLRRSLGRLLSCQAGLREPDKVP